MLNYFPELPNLFHLVSFHFLIFTTTREDDLKLRLTRMKWILIIYWNNFYFHTFDWNYYCFNYTQSSPLIHFLMSIYFPQITNLQQTIFEKLQEKVWNISINESLAHYWIVLKILFTKQKLLIMSNLLDELPKDFQKLSVSDASK